MGASIYSQYKHLTPEEREYIGSHPLQASIIKKNTEIAFSETLKRFGFNGRNDHSDAFRHCFWSALLARDLGYQNALKFTTAHESGPKNPSEEKEMDLHNNGVGLNIGKTGGKRAANDALNGRCYVALSTGQLKVLKK